MRKALFYNPRLFIERLDQLLENRYRLRKLKGTVATSLRIGHIDSLELLEILKPIAPSVIYDVGANIGTWTLLAKAVFPKAEVHAFEPLKVHIGRYLEMTRGLKDVHLHAIALGARDTTEKIKVTDFTDASSLLEIAENSRRIFGLTHDRLETVDVRRLDVYVNERGLKAPDLLKLDIQGYELAALRGGEKALAKVKIVIIEVSFIEFYKKQCMFHEIVEFLGKNKLYLRAFGANMPVGKIVNQVDALFSRESLL